MRSVSLQPAQAAMRQLRVTTLGSLVAHVRRELDLTKREATSLVYSQAATYHMVVDCGVRITDETTFHDLAHQTRETERRAATPGIRTIKFEVSPPRYLREAAEHILASPRRAHWVIGHWRNQPYGEKRAQHKQLWIKPHIRGLGEASATVAAVVAPHGEVPHR